MVIWESVLVFSGVVKTPLLSPLLLNPRLSGDGNWHRDGDCIGVREARLHSEGRVRPANSYQEGFHEPPFNLNFYKCKASLYFMLPLERIIPSQLHAAIFLACGDSVSHRVPTTSRDIKDIFWMENVNHTIKSISGRGLPGSSGKAGRVWERECQTLCKLGCNFEMVSLAVTFVFRCHWLRFSSIVQPFLPFLPLISLFIIIHSLSPFPPHSP